MKTFIGSSVLCLCLISTAHAVLDLQANYWLMTPQGDGEVGFDGLPGTRVDLKNDLGYDQSENIWGASLIAGGQNHQLGVDYIDMNISADSTIDRIIRFSDIEFPFQDHVFTALDATFIRAVYRFVAGSDTVQGGFMVGGQYIGFEARASSELAGAAAEKVNTGAPVLGVLVQGYPMDWLNLQGSLIGSDWDYGSVKASFLDWEISARAQRDPVYAGVGYRYINIDAEDQDEQIKLDLTLTGPVIFAGFVW